ncbi:ABC transporter ATP-binding protein [Natrarchaeobius chitinivorans]|uniref:ABC transporter ATP-binding protein n=1 Tax=Natrarchaeobius chitinivorans TaxID=1679083 RepID=A0A3N6M349_NATCH|nr:ABC transporter ATP-binding protein [Natrarchaeobius chitinivorans]RQG97883.1 ABC transporter ATP-binding protein [Natrarchaeobius chitinivorans]
MALLEVDDLTVQFYTEDGVVRAVDGFSYEIERGETFAIVGESGAGKSVASLSLLRLIERPGEIVDGEIRFRGRDVLGFSQDELRQFRGNDAAIAFQNPEAMLDPVYTVGEQIVETMRAHDIATGEAARDRAISLLERVDIADPESAYTDYPHELSGGMAQRAVIATALSCDPDLLILDEPTTGLDVTIQAQLLETLTDLAETFDTAIQLVTHDLGVVADCCDRALVMYAGRAVERAPVEELFYDPSHPYTAGLLASIPRIGDGRDRLPAVPGSPPDLVQVPTGCRFHPRCPYAEDVCATRDPKLVELETGNPVPDGRRPDHASACHEHTGNLEGGLDYEVRIVDDRGNDSTDSSGQDGAVSDGLDGAESDGQTDDETAPDDPETGGDHGERSR